jgi:MoaA/NifB/PqqE/SkfB family radical SAM enzyme
MKRILADVQGMGPAIIGLTGGEPLARTDIVELVAGIDDRSVTYLFTSGFGMTSELAGNLKRAGLFAVGISLDSADSAVMDARRGADGAHARAVEAVRLCREAGLYTMTQTVAERGMLESGRLKAVVDLSQHLGAHEVRILENMPSGRLAKIDPSRILTPQERDALRTFHTEMNRRKSGIKVAVFAHTEAADRFGCGAGTQHAYIDAAGHLFPCDFVPLSFGNVLERPVAELWRDMHRTIGRPRQTCMAMELYAKQLLAPIRATPVSPALSTRMIEQLEPDTEMPGFYRRALGKSA